MHLVGQGKTAQQARLPARPNGQLVGQEREQEQANAKGQADHRRDGLAARQCRGATADGKIQAAHQHNAQEHRSHRSRIERRRIIHVVAGRPETAQQRQPHHQVKHQRGGELRHHHLQVADGGGHQCFERAGKLFESEQPHCDHRGGQRQDHPHVQRAVELLGHRHLGGLHHQVLEHSVKAQVGQESCGRDNHIAAERKEVARQLAPGQRPVSPHQDSSSSGFVTRK